MPTLVALLVRFTGLSPILARLALVGGLVAAVLAGWGLHQWRAGTVVREAREAGAAAERRLWEAAAAKERDRRDQLAAAAEARGAEQAVTLRAERDDLAARLEELDHEALLDPDRDRCGLGAGGVRRLDAIR